MTANKFVVTPSLPRHLYEELGAAIRGDVYLRDDPDFVEYSSVFNGNVTTSAKAVVCPLDAEDVSRILIFCTKHFLSPSIKAGGYGTAGWAIGGDIIVDLNRLVGIDIEPPQEGGSFTSLRDMPFFGAKGKSKTSALITDSSSRKRRRQDDDGLRKYDLASGAVAKFLGGPPLSNCADNASRNVRQRLDSNPATASPRYSSFESESSKDSSGQDDGSIGSPSQSSQATVATSPSPSSKSNTCHYGSLRADPFGYLNNDRRSFPPPPPLASMQSGFDRHSTGYRPETLPANSPVPLIALGAEAVPIHPHAYVTFGAGVRQKEIDIFTAQNPLEVKSLSGNDKIPYHVPFSAHPVGSSIMLLGGFGFLSRLYGLSIDNLVEVEMVLADGRIIIVSNEEYPDLWWALRGAGPAFGVATRYKARAYPLPVVFAGNLIYRFRRATAHSLIKHFRDCVKGAPRELYANVLLTAGPAGKDSLVVIQICYVGPKVKGQEYLAAISSWDGEMCLLNEVDEKSFLHQQDSVAQVLRGKAGNQWFIRSTLVTSLPDYIINDTVIQFADSPLGCTWLFELAGGAIADFEDTCVPKEKREAAFTVAALHQWPMGVVDPRCKTSAEEWISGTLGPVSCGNPYPSFLARHESAARTISCYGDNWSRLCEIKRQYDPNGLFRNTFWPLGPNEEVLEHPLSP